MKKIIEDKIEAIAEEVIAKVAEHSDKHENIQLDCPFILSRREYFMTKRYLGIMYNIKTHSKLEYLYGVRVIREDKA